MGRGKIKIEEEKIESEKMKKFNEDIEKLSNRIKKGKSCFFKGFNKTGRRNHTRPKTGS